jgi:dolichol kinase
MLRNWTKLTKELSRNSWHDVMDRELVRQLIHASGVFVLILGLFLKIDVLILLCIIMVVSVEILFILDKYIHIPVFSSIMSICKRSEDERGFLYFFLGIIATLIIFSFNLSIAYSAILLLLIGDSLSTIVGRKFGTHKLPFNKNKSFEGSSAFFIVGLICCLILLPPIPAFTGVLAGTLTEAYSPVDDNIPIPLISALAMTLAMYMI